MVINAFMHEEHVRIHQTASEQPDVIIYGENVQRCEFYHTPAGVEKAGGLLTDR